MIAALAGQGYDVKRCCRIVGVRRRLALELGRLWLGELVVQVHAASGGRYVYRRVRAELRLGLEIVVSKKLVQKLMVEAGLRGVPTRKQRKNLVNVETAADLVGRDFARAAPNQLWLTDIERHEAR